jgi:hypothetical protein
MIFKREFERVLKKIIAVDWNPESLDPSFVGKLNIPVIPKTNTFQRRMFLANKKKCHVPALGPTKNFGDELDSLTLNNQGVRFKPRRNKNEKPKKIRVKKRK